MFVLFNETQCHGVIKKLKDIRVLMCGYDDHPVVRWRRAIYTDDLQEGSGDEAHTFGGTDYGVLTPRMREFGYGNETLQTLGSEFVGGLWEHIGHRTHS